MLYNQAAELISRSISKNFDAQGRPQKWPKRKYPYPWPILWKTGRMRARAEITALTWEHKGRTHRNKIYAPAYGFYHQYGTKRLPIRKFVNFIEQEHVKLRDLQRKVFLRK